MTSLSSPWYSAGNRGSLNVAKNLYVIATSSLMTQRLNASSIFSKLVFPALPASALTTPASVHPLPPTPPVPADPPDPPDPIHPPDALEPAVADPSGIDVPPTPPAVPLPPLSSPPQPTMQPHAALNANKTITDALIGTNPSLAEIGRSLPAYRQAVLRVHGAGPRQQLESRNLEPAER